MLGLLGQTLHKLRGPCTGQLEGWGAFPWGWPGLGLGDKVSPREKHWPWTPGPGCGVSRPWGLESLKRGSLRAMALWP